MLQENKYFKTGKSFYGYAVFWYWRRYLDFLIEEYYSDSQTKEKIVSQLAIILDNLNYIHPFREGNGRTQREVIRVLALAKGYELLINVDGQDEVYKQYMNGKFYSDVKLLEQLVSSLMEK